MQIKQYIGLPPVEARYTILRGAMLELMRVGIIQPAVKLATIPAAPAFDSQLPNHTAASVEAILLDVAVKAEFLSGRTLRKLPFLAHATYVQRAQCTAAEYVQALHRAVLDEHQDRSELTEAAENAKATAES